MYNAYQTDKDAPKILRPIYRDIREMDKEQVLSMVEQDLHLGDVTRIEIKFGTEMVTEYFDDGSLMSDPESVNDLLANAAMVDIPFDTPLFNWLAICSEMIRTKHLTPKYIVCRSAISLIRLAGLPEAMVKDATKLLNYSIAEFDGIRACDVFLAGVPTFRSPLSSTRIIYHNTYPEK